MDYNAITGFGKSRQDRDFYPTPRECTQALLDYLKIPPKSVIWECACGDGAMTTVFSDNGYIVNGTDILYGQDFLTHEERCDWIITNPPFYMADKFIERAAMFNVPFAFLLKATYWHSKNRLSLFREYTPSAILPLTWRPDFTGQGSSLMDMTWTVWDSGGVSTQTIFCPLEKPLMDAHEVGGTKSSVIDGQVELADLYMK